MPYTWTTHTEHDGTQQTVLTLWPHRSLPRRGFAVIILMTFTLITLPLYPLLGTAILWGLLPFLMLVVAALWWGLEKSYRDGEILEVLTMGPEMVNLRRQNPKGPPQEWDCNRYWVRVERHATGGPVPDYITLSGNGRMVEIGAFLSEEERQLLFPELSDALRGVA